MVDIVDVERWHEWGPEDYVERRWNEAREDVEDLLGLGLPWNSDRIHYLQVYLGLTPFPGHLDGQCESGGRGWSDGSEAEELHAEVSA